MSALAFLSVGRIAGCGFGEQVLRYRFSAPLLPVGTVGLLRCFPARPVCGLCCIIRKSKCSTDFKRNDFLKKNEAYPLGALRSLKFAYRKLRISLFVELAV